MFSLEMCLAGGNAYGNITSSGVVMPDRELYVRWAQTNALLPAQQFSLAPWDYVDAVNETVTLVRAMSDLHTAYAPLIYDLAMHAQRFK